MPATRIRRVGTTKLLRPLGEGGMAEVFLAEQENLQRKVAVKAIHPDLARKKEALERFRREAMALAALQHENIVAVHDLEEKGGQLFMIMEYVDGVDVLDLLDEGPLPLDVALLVANGVARALAHAHFRKVIHRDIKPANVMLSRFGEVKLADFGIAKDLTVDDMTKTGFIVGTPSYLAPEQITGGKADHRVDLYALGVLLYQCVSGKKPFNADNHGDLFAAIMEGRRPDLRKVAPSVPKRVARLIDRCMAVSPERRFQRASEVSRNLEQLLDRYLVGTPAGRLVRFLQERGQVKEEDLTEVDVSELDFVGDDESGPGTEPLPGAPGRPKGRLRRLATAAAVVGALLFAGTSAAYIAYPAQTSEAISSLLELARRAGEALSGLVDSASDEGASAAAKPPDSAKGRKMR